MTDEQFIPITWELKEYPIDQLVDYFKNPRFLTKDQFDRLKVSVHKFGLIDKPIVNLDLVVIGGHQRIHVLKSEGIKKVECWTPSRLLTEQEVSELNIRLNKDTGQWDFDILANQWEITDLFDWGFTKEELQLGGFALDEPDEEYTANIKAPLYIPKEEKPAINDLYDDKRAKELLSEIDASDLPEDEKEFLRVAARRHIVFNYKRIAEYYSHSEKSTQALMENSALVIIDFNRAIELGYVRMAEEIARRYGVDNGDEE